MNKLLVMLALLIPVMSFSQDTIINPEALCTQIAQMKLDDQLHRKELSRLLQQDGSRAKIDSLWVLQKRLDNKNTALLIELTTSYGWLSKERLGCDFKPLVFLIFRHSQDIYFDTIQLLIDQALKAGDLSSYHHNFIEDHLNGRPKG